MRHEFYIRDKIMARKKRRRAKKHTKATVKMTLQQREAKAKNALENGHYEKAIVNLKQLLKEDNRAEWQQDARYAHSQLVEKLAHHNKYRDVVSLYESGAKLCGFSLYTFEYVDALLASRQVDKAIRHYLSLQTDLDKSLLQAIRAALAACAIAGEKKVINKLPATDPVVIDYEPAFQLLNAYSAGNDEQVAKHLKAISFRSPYRDLRQIIAAAVKLDEDRDEACEQLQRIGTDSAFFALANTLQIATQTPKELLESWSSFSGNKQQLIKQIKGWGKDKDKLIKKLAILNEEPTFTDVFRIADVSYKLNADFFYTAAKKAAIHASALNNRVITLKRFVKRFPQHVANDHNEFMRFHFDALVATVKFEQEVIDDFEPFWTLENTWGDYLEALEKISDGEEKQDIALKRALIYRYMVDTILAKVSGLNKHLVDYIEKSIALDPKDKKSHTQLIRYYLDHKQSKQIRESVNLAIEHYPDDLEILLLAIEGAIASKAFKKAANYAKKILAVDPINRQARTLLCQAHLAHSRKQIKTQKWHLVEKELLAAEEWANEPIIYAIIAIQRACMVITQGKNNKNNKNSQQQAIDNLKQAQQLAETDLNAGFLIRLETASLGRRDAQSLHKLINLKWIPAKQQRKTVLFSFMAWVDNCSEIHDQKYVSQVLLALSPTLKSVIKKDITLAEYERILDFWQRTQQDALLGSYAKAAQKQYGQSPMLTYYSYVNARHLSYRDLDELDDAIDLAREQNDTVLASRLTALLKKHDSFDMPFDDDMEDDFFGGDSTRERPIGELPEPLREIFIHLIQESTAEQIIEHMSEMLGMDKMEMWGMHSVMGDDAFRALLIGVLEGKDLETLRSDFENGVVDTQKPAKKKKKGLFGLFDF